MEKNIKDKEYKDFRYLGQPLTYLIFLKVYKIFNLIWNWDWKTAIKGQKVQTGDRIFRLKSDFRLFSNSQDHSWDQCKSEEKFFKGGGVIGNGVKWHKKHWNAPFLESKKILGEDPHTPYNKPYPPEFLKQAACIPHQTCHYTLIRLFCQNPFWPLPELADFCHIFAS